MRTSPPRVVLDDRHIRVQVDVDAGAEPGLWFEWDHDDASMRSDRADWVAVALLMPAMRAGRDLHIGGVVTDVLLHQMNGDLQALLGWLHPGCSRIRVSADDAQPARAMPAAVAMGFSGGVDSFDALREYFLEPDVPEGLRVTHLLNNNVGAHGADGGALWDTRRAGLTPVAERLGLPFLAIDSNLDAHYPRIGFLQSATMRNAAVAHLLGGGIGRWHYASSNTFKDLRVQPGGAMSLMDPALLPLLSTSALTLSPAGSGRSRVDKTLALVGRPEARHLDVCIDPDPTRTLNCSRCAKCMRTMLTLEIAGHLDEFCPEPFVRGPYLAHRADFLVEVLCSDSMLAGEVRALAAARGWRWSLRTRGRAAARRIRDGLLRRARRWKRAVLRTPDRRSPVPVR